MKKYLLILLLALITTAVVAATMLSQNKTNKAGRNETKKECVKKSEAKKAHSACY